MRVRRVGQGAARVLIGVLIVVLSGLWVMTKTDFGRDRIRLYGLNQLADRVHGIVRIEQVHGDLLSGATLVDALITDSAGVPFLHADTIELRYSMRALFAKHIVFTDVRLVGAAVRFEQEPGGPWNVNRLFCGDTTITRGDTIPGWGDWVRLEKVTVVGSDVTVRREWKPPADLAGDALGEAVERALSPTSREAVERVPGGYQAVSSFHEVTGYFPVIRFADPISATRIVDIDTLRMIALPFRPPAAEGRGMGGRLTIGADTIGFDGVEVELPGSTLRVDGTYAFSGLPGGSLRRPRCARAISCSTTPISTCACASPATPGSATRS